MEINLLDEYYKIVAKSLNIDEQELRGILKISNLADYNLEVLIANIKKSDFLLGKIDTKPQLNNFQYKKCLTKIVDNEYVNFKLSKNQRNIKSSIDGQVAFQSIIANKLWRRKFMFKDEIVAQVVHCGGGINRLIMMTNHDRDNWVRYDFKRLYQQCLEKPLVNFIKIFNENLTEETLKI